MSVFEENPVLKILQHFGNVTMDTFSDRKRLQKISYLAQELGSNGGFTFTPYHYGPYSTTLTKLLYKGHESNSFSETIELSENEQSTVTRLQNLLGDRINDSDSLELFATVWYFLPFRDVSQTEQNEIIQQIIESKPWFERHQVQEALTQIIEFRRA